MRAQTIGLNIGDRKKQLSSGEVYEITGTNNLHGGGDLFIKNKLGAVEKCYSKDWNDPRKYSSIIIEREEFQQSLDPYNTLNIGKYATDRFENYEEIVEAEFPDKSIVRLIKHNNVYKIMHYTTNGSSTHDIFTDLKMAHIGILKHIKIHNLKLIRDDIENIVSESLEFQRQDPTKALNIGKHRQFNVGDQLIFLEKLGNGNKKHEWQTANYFFSINNFQLYTIDRVTDKIIIIVSQSGRERHTFNIEWFEDNYKLWKQIYNTNESLGFKQGADPYKTLGVGKYSDPEYLAQKEKDEQSIESIKRGLERLIGWHAGDESPWGGTVREQRQQLRYRLKQLKDKYKTDADFEKEKVNQYKVNQKRRVKADTKRKIAKDKLKTLTPKQTALNKLISLKKETGWRTGKKLKNLYTEIEQLQYDFNLKGHALRYQSEYDKNYDDTNKTPLASKQLAINKILDIRHKKTKFDWGSLERKELDKESKEISNKFNIKGNLRRQYEFDPQYESLNFNQGGDPYKKLDIGKNREIPINDEKLWEPKDAHYYSRVLGFTADDEEEPYSEVAKGLKRLADIIEKTHNGDIDWYAVDIALADQSLGDEFGDHIDKIYDLAQRTWMHA